jgi:hypothetical protein
MCMHHTSCGGMSKVTVLKSTTLTLSRHGRTKKSPGPLAFPDVSRPRRRITALSYSFTIYASACVRTTWTPYLRAQRHDFYLDRHKQRKWKEHNDHYKRNHGQNVAAASQTILSRCSYFDICREGKDCAQIVIARKKGVCTIIYRLFYWDYGALLAAFEAQYLHATPLLIDSFQLNSKQTSVALRDPT